LRGGVANPPDKYDQLVSWQKLGTGVILLGGKADDVRNPLDEPKMSITYGPPDEEKTVNGHALSINPRGALVLPKGSDPVVLRIAEGAYRNGKASPNMRGVGKSVSENRLKIGRVTARAYQAD
jgi:hypothetical protein